MVRQEVTWLWWRFQSRRLFLGEKSLNWAKLVERLSGTMQIHQCEQINGNFLLIPCHKIPFWKRDIGFTQQWIVPLMSKQGTGLDLFEFHFHIYAFYFSEILDPSIEDHFLYFWILFNVSRSIKYRWHFFSKSQTHPTVVLETLSIHYLFLSANTQNINTIIWLPILSIIPFLFRKI